MSTAPDLLALLLTDEVLRILAALHHLFVTAAGDDLLDLDLAGSTVLVTFLGTLVTVLTHLLAILLTAVVLVPGVVGVAGELWRTQNDYCSLEETSPYLTGVAALQSGRAGFGAAALRELGPDLLTCRHQLDGVQRVKS